MMIDARHTTDGEPRLQEPPALHADLRRLSDEYRALSEEHLDLQTQIIRAEKLAGIGRLAAGVAHEIRNPLGALSTYVEVLRMREADPEITAAMRTAIERIDRIVGSLLTYSRPGSPDGAGVVDAGAAVATALDFLRAQGLFRFHELTLEASDGLPPVRGDRHQLEQVVVNLVCNACDTAPQTRLWVGVRAQPYDPRHRVTRRRADDNGAPAPARTAVPRPRRPELAAGTPGVLIYVADDGPGVPEADRDRIFDPFFSTKEPGKGTGLGLAIVARTVEESGGMVWVDRAREGGAAFKIFLPAVDGD